MRLLVDLGNSRLKWVLNAPGRWELGMALHQGEDMTRLLDDAWGALEAPQRIVMTSVAAKELRQALDQWATRRWSLVPYVVQAQRAQLGVTNSYREPASLGADRWAALIGARALTQTPACIVDCGTAVTVDALSADGVFLGGAIFPGLRLLRQSLAQGAAALPLAFGDDTSCLARATADGIAAGTMLGLLGAIERMLVEQQKVIGPGMQVFLTGGDAPLLAARLTQPAIAIPDLVLKGLARIADTL